MTIEVRIRGRYHPLPGATARRVGANAWQVRIPRTPEAERLLRRWEVEALDGLVLALDGEDAIQVIGSDAGREELVATVLLP